MNPAGFHLCSQSCRCARAMQVLLNRKVNARDTVRRVSNRRIGSLPSVCCRCRQCGFVAFRSLERCPVCGRRGWPFETHAGTALAGAPARSSGTWVARLSHFLHDAAVQQPRASTAPVLSIATLVLLFGGYVVFDRMCSAGSACRAQDASVVTTVIADLPAPADQAARSDRPPLPMPSLPVYAFHLANDARVSADEGGGAGVGQRADGMAKRAGSAVVQRVTAGHKQGRALAARSCTGRAAPGCPPPKARALQTTTQWQGGGKPTRSLHQGRGFSLHAGVARRPMPKDDTVAKLYRGH